MKKNILIPLFVLCITQAFGQTGWPPIGAKWHYSYVPCDIWGGCSAKEFIYFEAVKDTLVNDTLCTKIIVEHHNGKKEVKYLGDEFIYSTENQVYSYHHGHFNLLYDFSLQVGDTVALQLGSNCNLYDQMESSELYLADPLPVNHIVVEKDSVEIDGKKYLFMDMGFTSIVTGNLFYLFFGNKIIIKGIGSLDFLTGKLTNPIESGIYGPLRCYSDSSMNYTTDVPCELITSAESFNSNQKIWIYPNPVTSNSLISFPNEMKNDVVIEILDIEGRIISSTETCEKHVVISSEKLSTGVFFYRIYSNNDVIGSGRFLKK